MKISLVIRSVINSVLVFCCVVTYRVLIALFSENLTEEKMFFAVKLGLVLSVISFLVFVFAPNVLIQLKRFYSDLDN